MKKFANHLKENPTLMLALLCLALVIGALAVVTVIPDPIAARFIQSQTQQAAEVTLTALPTQP